MIIISHDRHFLNQVCTHMADLDYGKITRLSGQLRRLHGGLDAGARAAVGRQRQGQGTRRRTCRTSCAASRPTSRRRARPPRAPKQIEKIKIEDIKPSSRQYPWIGFDYDEKEKLHRHAVEIEKLVFGYDPKQPVIKGFTTTIEAGDKVAIIGENGVGKTTLLRLLAGERSTA